MDSQTQTQGPVQQLTLAQIRSSVKHKLTFKHLDELEQRPPTWWVFKLVNCGAAVFGFSSTVVEVREPLRQDGLCFCTKESTLRELGTNVYEFCSGVGGKKVKQQPHV